MRALSGKAGLGLKAENKDKLADLFRKIFFAVVVLAIVYHFFPEAIPFGPFELWDTKGSPSDWITSSWPILVWAIGVTSLCFLTRNHWKVNRKAGLIFAKGTLISVAAGVVEEICFRWILFLHFIVMAKVINFLLLGFIGLGIIEAFQVYISGPIANFFTFGYLGEYLGNPTAWAVGVGILSANALFRNGHKYQGIVGFVNSWFIGMFMFILLFKYGLLACILVHFLYDFLIFFIQYVDMVIERRLGWATPPRRTALDRLLEMEKE